MKKPILLFLIMSFFSCGNLIYDADYFINMLSDTPAAFQHPYHLSLVVGNGKFSQRSRASPGRLEPTRWSLLGYRRPERQLRRRRGRRR